MADKTATRTLLQDGVKIVWDDVDGGESCDAVECSEYPIKEVHLSGTITTAVIQGSNEAAFANPFTLTGITQATPEGGPINAAGGWRIVDNPLAIRPLVTTGTAVKITLLCRK